MPRAKPFQCRRCGTLYTGGRCPKCYPARKRRVTCGRKSGGGVGRRTASAVLGRAMLPVNVEALDAVDSEIPDVVESEANADADCFA